MTPLAFVALGILGGVFVTAPLGPVNILIIQRAMRYGLASGVAAGAGAAFADVVFAGAAAFGVSSVRAVIEGNSQLIQLLGGTVVGLIGAQILWRYPRFDRPVLEVPRKKSAFELALTTFFLTITSPATIFGFVAYFGALGEWGPQQGDTLGTAQMLLGVAIGAFGWWCGLATLVTRLRLRLNDGLIAKFNVIAGSLLVGFGALILGRLSVTYFGYF